MSVVAISWDKSENRLANPMPSTVRFSQRMPGWLFLRLGVEEGAFIAAKDCLQKPQKRRARMGSSKRLSAVDKKRRLRDNDGPRPFDLTARIAASDGER
jgi:hypothetical protein